MGLLGLVVLWVLLGGVRIVNQVERGIVFRFGQAETTAQAGPRHPDLVRRPDAEGRRPGGHPTRSVAGGHDCDNVSVKVDAVVYFRVEDPLRATIEVRDFLFAVEQVTQTSLRSVIGKSELDDLLANRDQLHRDLTGILAEPLLGWGIRLHRVERTSSCPSR